MPVKNIQTDIKNLRIIARRILKKINGIIESESIVEQADDKAKSADKMFISRGSLITSLIGIADLLFKLDQYEKSLHLPKASSDNAEIPIPLADSDLALVEMFLAKIRRDSALPARE